jgi:hypothetical protein
MSEDNSGSLSPDIETICASNNTLEIRKLVSGLMEELARKEALLRAAIAGQHTLIRAIADSKTDAMEVAKDAWEAARLVNGDTLMDTWLVFEDWWKSQEAK